MVVCTANLSDLEERIEANLEHQHTIRSFYNSNKMAKQKGTAEIRLRKARDRVCAVERSSCSALGAPVMFVGDRGYGAGSHIKGHVKYGGRWKQEIHSRYTSVFISNEHNSSQTCLFCFAKLAHPLKIISKNGEQRIVDVKGTFRCLNKKCVLYSCNATHKGRDAVSAFAIGLAGATNILLGKCMPVFDPTSRHDDNTSNITEFKHLAEAFLNRSAFKPFSDGDNTL